jgi:hypothetical protein
MASRSQIKITYTISRSRSQNQDQFSAEDRDLKITDFEDQVILPIYDQVYGILALDSLYRVFNVVSAISMIQLYASNFSRVVMCSMYIPS